MKLATKQRDKFPLILWLFLRQTAVQMDTDVLQIYCFQTFSGNVFSEEVVKSHKIFFNPTELKLKDISNETKTKEMTIEMTD